MSTDEEFLLEIRKDCLEEFAFLLEQCEESYLKLERPEARAEELAKIFRLAHSIKGGAAVAGFQDLAAFAHAVEDCLVVLRSNPELVSTSTISLLLRCGDAYKARVEQLRKNPSPDAAASEPWDVSALEQEVRATIRSLKGDSATEAKTEKPVEFPSPALDPSAAAPRKAESSESTSKSYESNSVKVDIDRIDSILDIVGELLVIKSQLVNRAQTYGADQSLNEMTSVLDKTVRELQDKTLSMRLMPLKSLFLKAQRTVRDLALRLDKPVDFVIAGEETEIDRSMVELLSDPLTHLVRNAVDHGLESPEQRRAAGKPERGSISLGAYMAGGRVVIEIRDDGRGINREAVLRKAIANGIVTSDKKAEQMSHAEVCQLIFAAGFSTAEVVSDVSGRGVGLDVVKTNIEKLHGDIEVLSTAGKGTCFRLSLPLTTSITDGMLVRAYGHRYILPMDGIRELVELRSDQLTVLSTGEEVLRIRDQLFPLLSLRNFLESDQRIEPRKSMAVIVENKGKVFGIRVHEVLGQIQVVLKPLTNEFSGIEGLAGSAILGDGTVALVFDVDGLSRRLVERLAEAPLVQAA